MTTASDPVPEGYTSVTPWIVTRDTAGLLDFLKAAFGAEELGRVPVGGSGAIGHAEARIGTAIVMMFDSPFKVDTPAMLRLWVDDADEALERALAAGAALVTPVTDVQAWGDRVARLRDPFGNLWWLQERVEEPDPEDVMRRMDEPKYRKAFEQTQIMDAPGLV
ncbi:VOC family protein [Glycomyces tenuis]|uniref:VOC family protein n=1 Tax=Glycomyces tenuis TaxID=58116 RepID=UPI00040F5D02|nr:VOC family protein [Glycomyces tenuis]